MGLILPDKALICFSWESSIMPSVQILVILCILSSHEVCWAPRTEQPLLVFECTPPIRCQLGYTCLFLNTYVGIVLQENSQCEWILKLLSCDLYWTFDLIVFSTYRWSKLLANLFFIVSLQSMRLAVTLALTDGGHTGSLSLHSVTAAGVYIWMCVCVW